MVVKGPANKNQQPHFGRYHHSTQRGSEKIREKIEILFTEALGDLPFSRHDEPKILDIGCGLGFLSLICAKYYPNGMITGIDTFQHTSLKNSSLAKAKNNMKILGFSERIRFQKGRKEHGLFKYVNVNVNIHVTALLERIFYYIIMNAG